MGITKCELCGADCEVEDNSSFAWVRMNFSPLARSLICKRCHETKGNFFEEVSEDGEAIR